ncbi:MAG: aminopeptidase P family protein [Candidatus Roizmanbacteria bacterium]|nr:MAG: aminopeptidase P family protein [Candidatus Roizmanbacteria bacterium]
MNNRIGKFRKIFLDKNYSAFLVTNPYNIAYLTGFNGLSPEEREAFLFLTLNNSYFFTYGTYFNLLLVKKNKTNNITTYLIEPGKNIYDYLSQIIEKDKINNVGFEADDLKFSEHEILKQKTKINLIAASQLINKQRTIKDKEEIENIQKACDLIDKCLKDIIKIIKVGISESEIFFLIEKWIKTKGYGLAFAPIVAVDANSALPHYSGEKNSEVKKGSIVLIDCGVKYKGYVSDITRVFLIGKRDDDFTQVYNQLLEAQKKTIEEIKIGMECKFVDEFCRQECEKNNLPNYLHSTGHSLGLEIHELPRFATTSSDIVEDNQVFTIEPGVYIEGKWGIRIEDTIVMKNGEAEILTKFPKKLMVL